MQLLWIVVAYLLLLTKYVENGIEHDVDNAYGVYIH